MNQDNIQALVDNLFRHESGRMVATLTRIFGAENLQLAEDVVQETLIKALQQWSYRGIPENPSAWLMQVAKNRALDLLRREANYQQKLNLLENKESAQSLEDHIHFDNHLDDVQVAMLFMGCHPALSQEMQVTLLLKTLGGFSVSEIAHAFLLPETTVAQRIVRAKRKLREESIEFSLPNPLEFEARLDTVLMVIYLIFSEGYKASEGLHLIRDDLCKEAIRLCEIVLKHPQGNTPKVHALMALMLLQVSRLATRIDNQQLMLLSEQDRSRWNQQAIQMGLFHLAQSADGDVITSYHLQAGIAACHALAKTYEETDWSQILTYYEQLIQIENTPFVHLNQLVALAMTGHIQDAIAKLKQLKGLEDYYLYYATLADFEMRLGNRAKALEYYCKALNLCHNLIEKQFIQRKIASL